MHELLPYRPEYQDSWALVIGINAYDRVSPLQCARADAEAVAGILTSRFGFPSANVTTLLDGEATADAIYDAFLGFAGDKLARDDRLVVFFAGHGLTRSGYRGEIGYLAPVDGDPTDIRTLLRWDDLTRNSELIGAKHVLFLMDACYGGLALTRKASPGSSRFMKDMLQRYARQVLTAGKADETVADAGGPRPGHSMFTGHLLNGLEGAAADGDVLSANGLMAYVYGRVAKDTYSRQTPHYGYCDGDGDFIFSFPKPQSVKEETADQDILIVTPPELPTGNERTRDELVGRVKETLSDSRYRIELDDLVSAEVRTLLSAIREEEFPVTSTALSMEDFNGRLRRYEDAVGRLMPLVVLMSRWGGPENLGVLEKIIARLGEANAVESGSVVWLDLRWYPLELLSYSGGVAAVSARNYAYLNALFLTNVPPRISGMEVKPAIMHVVSAMRSIELDALFKRVPGHERQFVPLSEYLFKAVQPVVEDLLFLGGQYDQHFDRFELLQALTFADLKKRQNGRVWGPIGRFAWKHARGTQSPFSELVEEAKSQGDSWGPIRAGMFGGSSARFLEVAGEFLAFMETLSFF